MPSTLLAIPKTYAELLRGVKAVMFAGQREIEFAWEFSDWENLAIR